ncbi:MAG: hypothetical protein ACREPE_02250 [Lysobacter sp.]
MRPSLTLIAIAACFVSSLASAQHPGSNVATPATALAARPADNVTAGATAVKSQSAFGRAMAELTRSMREPKQTKRADGMNVDGVDRGTPPNPRSDEAPATSGTSDQESNPLAATSDVNGS